MVSAKLKNIIGDKENELIAKSKELLEINKKIEKLETRLMNDEIETSTYKNWFQKYSSEKALTIKDITRLKNSGPDKWQRLERFAALTNIFDIYEKAKISDKINLVKGVFKHNLVYSEGA